MILAFRKEVEFATTLFYAVYSLVGARLLHCIKSFR